MNTKYLFKRDKQPFSKVAAMQRISDGSGLTPVKDAKHKVQLRRS